MKLKDLKKEFLKPGDIIVGVKFDTFHSNIPVQKTKWLEDLKSKFDDNDETGLKVVDGNVLRE